MKSAQLQEHEAMHLLQRDAAALACVEVFQVKPCHLCHWIIWCMLTKERHVPLASWQYGFLSP